MATSTKLQSNKKKSCEIVVNYSSMIFFAGYNTPKRFECQASKRLTTRCRAPPLCIRWVHEYWSCEPWSSETNSAPSPPWGARDLVHTTKIPRVKLMLFDMYWLYVYICIYIYMYIISIYYVYLHYNIYSINLSTNRTSEHTICTITEVDLAIKHGVLTFKWLLTFILWFG